ncbi:MAG: DUF2062 domain-containing protein [Denitrovibrio sp.]|nr:MAG: DUF2062 domain-containing protein [Denitrovibrio sp.]
MVSRLRVKVQKILQLDCPPNRIATAAAVGVIVGFSPYIGFHTVLAIGLSFIFNLPLYPLIVGAYITNPLTFIPIYTLCYKAGEFFTGQHAEITVNFSDLTFSTIFTTAKTFIVPFFVGAHLLGLILGAITYILSYYLVKKYKDSV